MTIGLAGASGTGKTTLAKMIANETTLTYHDASITRLMKEAGIDGVSSLSIDDRVTLQEKILDLYVQDLKKQPGMVITDRTPLDMIGYMLGDVTMHNTDLALGKRIHAYVQRCLKATQMNFDSVIILRPLPFYQANETRPPMNPAYQYLVQYIIEGAARDTTTLNWVCLWDDDLNERLSQSIQFLQERHDQLQAERNHYSLH